jgi:hypothetical protein
MAQHHSTHSHHPASRLGRFVRRLFSAPFEALPSAFGDQTPPDLSVLQAEVEEARHDVVETPSAPGVHARSSKRMRRK